MHRQHQARGRGTSKKKKKKKALSYFPRLITLAAVRFFSTGRNEKEDDSEVVSIDNSLVGRRTGTTFTDDEIPLKERTRSQKQPHKTNQALGDADENEGLLGDKHAKTE
jgi:hypothetical protein